MSEADYFLKAYKAFEAKHEFICRIYVAVGKQNPDSRRRWANLMLFRLGISGNSLLLLCCPELRELRRSKQRVVCVLDPSSIATLGRHLLEAWVMFAYVSDPAAPDEEWRLRRSVLELHDTIARCRILKVAGEAHEQQEFRTKMESLREAMNSNALFQKLPEKDRAKLLSGEALYLRGRNAVIREAGWDVEHFGAMYAALSSHAHNGPTSFYRTVIEPEQPVEGFRPDFAYVVAGLVLEYATEPLAFACERMFNLYPEVFLTDRTKH